MLIGLSVGATGSVLVANSSIVTNYDWLSCGANGYGTLTLKDNALYAENSDFNFGDYGGNGTTGILTIQDNAQVVMIGNNNGVYVGKTAGSVGIVYQSGNSVINSRTAGTWQLAQQAGSSGTWYQNGGTNYAGGYVSIGRGYAAGDATPTGLLIVSGGLFDQVTKADGLIVGEQGTGTLVITNTGVVISEANTPASASTNAHVRGLAISWNGGNGEVDLGGGTLIVSCIQVGTNLPGYSVFNFNGGTLVAGPSAQLDFMSGLSSAVVYHTTTIDTSTNTIAIAQPLMDAGLSLNGGITKIGNGTLLLDGANTYAGTTTVSAGTLGGIGSITGPVVVNGGATLAPGDSGVGTLTLASTLNLSSGSQTVMRLSRTNALTSSSVGTPGAVTYGGTLVLQNISGSMLQVGDTFTNFTAGSYSGSFSSVLSQTPGQTVTWDLSKLSVDGTVKVAAVVAAPVTLKPVVSGGMLNLNWPTNQIGWELQHQVDPLTTGIGTNWVAVPGSTATNAVSLPLDKTEATEFFRLVFPPQ